MFTKVFKMKIYFKYIGKYRAWLYKNQQKYRKISYMKDYRN